LLATAGIVALRPNTKSNIKVAKPQAFDGTARKVLEFLTAYKLFIIMIMRDNSVKEQIQRILSSMQRELVDVWKENILEDLEAENLEYKTAKEFLADLKKEFGEEDKEAVKVVELKRLEQEKKKIKDFVQEFRRIARKSKYEGKSLMEEFK